MYLSAETMYLSAEISPFYVPECRDYVPECKSKQSKQPETLAIIDFQRIAKNTKSY